MENIQIILIVAFGFTGLFILLLGYLIRENQLVEIIAMPHYSIEKIKDKAAFSRFAGKYVNLIGLLTLITAAMIAILPQILMITIILFSAAVILICITFIIFSEKYFYSN